MFTSAELIEALRRRLRRSIRPLPAGETFPPGWQAWFASMREKLGAVTGAPAQAIVEVLLQRDPPPPPAAVAQLTRWQAFGALWRQQWHPASEDERGLRVLSTTLSFLLHLFLIVMLSWLMHARFMVAPAEAQRGEHVVEVEFIGQGTPEEEGGAPPDAPAVEEDEQLVEDSPPAAVPQPAPEPRLPPPAVASSEPERPSVPPPPAEQPLVVTETVEPDSSFQLPPPRPPDLTQARVREVEVAPRTRDIELAEIREVAPPSIRQAEVEVPDLEQPQLEVVEREIAAPVRPLPLPEIAAPTIPTPMPAPRQQAQEARVREIPMPAAREREAPGTRSASAPAPAEGASAQAPSQTADAAGRQPEALAPGTGTAPAPGEGAWRTPQRGDDWGASARDRPGGQQGASSLFNPDGSPRLPSDDGRVGGGLPPGTITEDYEKIDRMGTWLRRPPADYEPTSFDRFWVPHESLLQEWVRRSVRTVLIPIPGTSKSIRCDVVTLAVAGGCGIVDPNMQDNPAGARPPPDVPFRPELQEDQEGLSDDVWR